MEHVAARGNDLTDREEADRQAEIVTRLAMLHARFGDAFTGEGLTIARGAIEAALKREAQLRRVSLRNADEPVGVFVPFRGPRPGGPA